MRLVYHAYSVRLDHVYLCVYSVRLYHAYFLYAFIDLIPCVGHGFVLKIHLFIKLLYHKKTRAISSPLRNVESFSRDSYFNSLIRRVKT